MKYQKPRGTQDFLPDYLDKWNYVANIWRKVVAKYNFREIITPMFENTELFNRTAGDTSDIVTKEMYTFTDRGGRSVTLRPEGTAAVVRAYFENNLNNNIFQPVKLFYIMPMFRYERPQAGRFRQHHQYGVECIGVRSPYIDADIMTLFMDFYKELGVVEPVIWLNSLGCDKCRPKYKELLISYLKENTESLCDECRTRLERNPLRVLDCKNASCRNVIDRAPLIIDHLCPDCANDFETVKKLLDRRGINYVVSPMLVRGLDYYNRTVFEVAAKGVSAKEVIAGGGRYDYLLKEIGGVDSSAFGAGAGMERLISTLETQGVSIPIERKKKSAVVPLSTNAMDLSFDLAHKIRDYEVPCELVISEKKLGKLLSSLETAGFDNVILIGDDELARLQVAIRNLVSREQVTMSLSNVEAIVNLLR